MTSTTDQSSTRFRIGDLNIFVRSDVHELIDDFAALYPGSTGAEPAHGRTIRMDVRKVGRRRLRRQRYDIYGDGEMIHADIPVAELLPYLEWGITWRFVIGCTEYVQVHAASMARDGRGLVLAGDSGAGKSTLAAALLARGWDYLCDEFALINPETLELHPYPKALCIKAGSFEAVSRLGLRLSRDRHYVKSIKGKVGYISLSETDTRIAAPCPVRLVLFPTYTGAGSPRLRPMTRAEAAFHLAGHTLNRDVFGHRVVPVLGQVTRNARCFGLDSGRLDETCDLIESVFDETNGDTP